ncbi:uncharacterized protein LOC133306299 isoform X2 [Gastrolobium bilobum]|uniref:uncharacterized protein LOC133306299 isoform X2 n=1 Tax=Gastrolobium bilobum TaxID=150636 RepID=UPI002AAFA4BF|nr:uncharacterized protein LOC133306299 isoform X2 [Gastrolobium bilobum]
MLFLYQFYFLFFCFQNLFSGTMPKRKRGRPKGSSVQKKVKESIDLELFILDNPSNVLEVDPGIKQEQETDTDMPKKRGRGRPKGSETQNCQQNVHGNLNSHINPSNIVEVGVGCEESEDPEIVTIRINEKGGGQPGGSRMQKCQENADCNLDINSNLSDMMEVSLGCNEEQETDAVNILLESGQGQPSGSMNQKKHQQNADDINVTPKIKRRGTTRGWMVEMKRQQSPDGKLDVLIHPTRLVAVGPGRKDFITDLSVIVRRNARLNVCQWRKVPQSTRDAIVQNVLKNWRLQDTGIVRKAILDEAGRLYRNWRNMLHDYYVLFETKEEALKHVPDDISDSDWKILVDYFSSPSFEIISAKNKANRAKLMTNHTCGQRSFQAISYDARDPVTGKEPDLQTLWQMTHKKANGEWVDEASKEVNDKVAEQIDEMLVQPEDAQDEIEIIEEEIISSAFKKVVGRKSYMHGFGAGLSSSSSSKSQQLHAELEAQKRETENAKKECSELRAKLVEVESQLEEERRKREETETHRLDRQKEMDRKKEMQEMVNSQVQAAVQAALSQYCLPTTEAESSSKQKKIAELEEQLHEAEDVITDIRSELLRYRMR